MFNTYKRLIMKEQAAFDATDFSSPDRPYLFGNICEEVMFRERNPEITSLNVCLGLFPVLLFDLADKHCSAGNYTFALQAYEKGFIWNPAANATFRCEYGELLLRMGDFETATENAKEAFRYAYRPKDFELLDRHVRNIMGPAAKQLSEDALKVKLKESGFEIDSPEHIATVLLQSANTMEDEGNIKDALTCYKAVQELSADEALTARIHKLEKLIESLEDDIIPVPT